MCRLCQKEKLTPWYVDTPEYWVAEDADPKGYPKRILGVYNQHSASCPIPVLAKIITDMISIAHQQNLLVRDGWLNVAFDGEVSIRDHWHIQLNVLKPA